MKTEEQEIGAFIMKFLLRTVLGLSMAALVLGTPPAYAVLGIRAARKVIAARKAERMLSSTSADKSVSRTGERSAAQARQKTGDGSKETVKSVGGDIEHGD